MSFAEGAAVMAAEICGAKLIAPFYGSSLYVWSSVMAVTLSGLAAGYFLGGKLSVGGNKLKVLQRVAILAIACLLLMPFLPALFYHIASRVSLIPAVVSSVFILLFPTMLCMGATSPLVVACLTQEAGKSGESSGRVYAISTVGGILATFLCGFYCIPEWGLTITLSAFAGMLLAATLLYSFNIRALKSLSLLLLLMLLAAYGFVKAPKNNYTIYQREGILGKLEVREEPSPADPAVQLRKLAINNIVQTEMDMATHRSVSAYAKLLEKNLAWMPAGKALVLGLGGGVVSNMLHDHAYEVTAVEFDSRITDMAKLFFYLDPSIVTVNDDARHYINGCHEPFNLVLFDIFKAEEQPAHVITTESLSRLKHMLYPGAVVIINTHGYLEGEKGRGTQCILSTLKASGFEVKVCSESADEDFRNLLIYASLQLDKAALHDEIYPYVIGNSTVVNTDARPILEKLNAPANQAWRSNYIKNYILFH